MGKESVMLTGETIFALIEMKFGSDAKFERQANLPPKTVNNWRRVISLVFIASPFCALCTGGRFATHFFVCQ